MIMKTTATIAVTALLGSLAIGGPATAQVSARTDARAEVRGQLRQGSAQQGSAQQPSQQNNRSVSAESVIRATAEAGLPEAPVRRTVAEGEAKGAAEAEVVRAALRTQGRLVLAREALESGEDRQPSHREITLGAEVLARGGSRGDLERIADAAPEGRSLEASLLTMLSVQGSGRSASGIAGRIAAQLSAGASDQSVGALGGLDLSSSVSGALSGANVAGSLAGGVSGAGGGSAAAGGAAAGSAAGSVAGSVTSGAGTIGAGVSGSIGTIVP
jgi:hypothetical protein